MQKPAKQPQAASATGAAQPPVPPRATAKHGKAAVESPASANADDTQEETVMPVTPVTPEHLLNRFDDLLKAFEKQRADNAERDRAAAERERAAAERQAQQNQVMAERLAQIEKDNAERAREAAERERAAAERARVAAEQQAERDRAEAERQAKRDQAIAERFAQIDRDRAEHDRVMAERQAERDRAAVERDRIAAEQQAKRDQAITERFAALDTKIERQGKETAKTIMLATFGIIASVGVFTAILGAWIAFLEFRGDNTTPAPAVPAVVQYLSPQAEQPAPPAN